MSSMTLIASHQAIGSPILTNHDDEESGEEIVALFIARLNSLRQAQGLPDLCVGALQCHEKGATAAMRVERRKAGSSSTM